MTPNNVIIVIPTCWRLERACVTNWKFKSHGCLSETLKTGTAGCIMGNVGSSVLGTWPPHPPLCSHYCGRGNMDTNAVRRLWGSVFVLCLVRLYFLLLLWVWNKVRIELNCLCSSRADNNSQHILTPSLSHMDILVRHVEKYPVTPRGPDQASICDELGFLEDRAGWQTELHSESEPV